VLDYYLLGKVPNAPALPKEGTETAAGASASD
jgi:hypothetical protein